MLARFTSKTDVLRTVFRRIHNNTSGGQNQGGSSSSGSPPPVGVNTEVPGLSNAVVLPASQPVGPGVEPNKTGAYKSPEYFCYHTMSYFEAEIEMSKYRVPQPSALRK